MAKNVFITGSNGFLGRNMLETLLKSTNDNFCLLVRSEASKKSISEHVGREYLSRIKFVSGDLTLPWFGMNQSDIENVLSCADYWHFAAATSFDDRKKESIIATNIGGANNISTLAEANKSLNHLFFISTAYVAGRNKGIIYEDKMPVRNGFKNSYEESKYDAEIIIRNSDTPWTIFRPSIVVGNSKTLSCQGETRMIYGYILGIYTALLKHFDSEDSFVKSWCNKIFPYVNIRMKGCYKTKKNFVCIDDVIGMISDIIKNNCNKKTYHLTSNNIIGDNISSAFNYGFRVKGLNYVGSKVHNPNRIERFAHRITSAFDDYCLNDDPEWDTTNTNNALTFHNKTGMNKVLFVNLIESFIENEIINKFIKPQVLINDSIG